jgi:outer membrane protein OmpA-like peptidoglycan-associated protein
LEISAKFIPEKYIAMKHPKFFLIFLFVSCLSFTYGQSSVNIRKSEFKKDKNGFDGAWQHVVDGNSFFKNGGIWYRDAYDEYVRAGIYNSGYAELNYMTGVAALYSDNKEKASDFLLKALEEKSTVADDILLLCGRALQFAGRYPEAIAKINEWLNSPVKKSEEETDRAKRYLEACNNALQITKDTLRLDIRDLGTDVNSSADDYSEIFTATGNMMYFASRREFPKYSTIYADGRYDENIFFSSLINGAWGPATFGGTDLNTKLCESPVYISPSGDQLYIYAGYENGGDIKVSVQKKGTWRAATAIDYNINTSGSESSFTVNPSGNEVWFVTDKGKDAIGGKDIYFIKRLGENKWSKPVNAGANINSSADEESVRFSETGDTIWFGSKGFNSMGGFDIFYSVKDSAGVWGKAVNCGYPLNTQWDELFYNKPKGSKSFYFVSNRPGTLGGLDIFEGKPMPPKQVVVPPPPPAPAKRDTIVIRDTVVVVKEMVQAPPVQPVVAPPPPQPKELILYLAGKVKDSETSDPILAKIDIIDLSTDQNIATTASSDVDGTYKVRLPAKKSYMVDFRGSGYLSEMKQINIPESYSADVFTLDVSLIKVKVGKKVVLNNILFQLGKAILTTGSYAELDKLYGILTDNPQMKIEISGHTDKTGSEPLNFKLSEDRAKSVVEYLVRKGIDRSRLDYRGYGSLQPIADNGTEAGRAKNRRVEFKILEF